MCVRWCVAVLSEAERGARSWEQLCLDVPIPIASVKFIYRPITEFNVTATATSGLPTARTTLTAVTTLPFRSGFHLGLPKRLPSLVGSCALSAID